MRLLYFVEPTKGLLIIKSVETVCFLKQQVLPQERRTNADALKHDAAAEITKGIFLNGAF